MTEPLQVGQFAIVDHEPVDRGPGAGIFRGRGPSDDRSELYILAEGTTSAGEGYAGHIVSALGKHWGTLDISLTGSLQRLFEEADLAVRDWNRKSIPEHQVAIGLTCLARRGGQTVVAQAGPSVAFLHSNGHCRSLVPDGDHTAPIGSGQPVAPQLMRIDLGPGNRLLLISTAARETLDEELVGDILALPGEQVLSNIYRGVEHLRYVTVVLVAGPPAVTQLARHSAREVLPEEDDDTYEIGGGAAPPPVRAELRFQPSLFVSDGAGDAALATARRQLTQIGPRPRVSPLLPRIAVEVPEPLSRAVGDDGLSRLALERTVRGSTGKAAWASSNDSIPSIRSGPVVFTAPSPLPEPSAERRKNSFSRGLVPRELPSLTGASEDEVPMVEDLAADRRNGGMIPIGTGSLAKESTSALHTGGSLVRMRGDMGGRWKGGGGLSRHGGGRMPPPWLVALGGIAILVALVAFLALPRMFQQQSELRYEDLLNGAQQQMATALVQEDPNERRKSLNAAQAMLLEAEELDAGGGESEQLGNEVASAIREMDAIIEPAAVEVVGSLEEFGERPVAATRFIAGDHDAYILDGASNQVIAVSLDGGAHRVVYGESTEAGRGKPIAAAYTGLESFVAPALLIADSNRKLWASSAGGVSEIAFAAPEGLRITDIAIFGRDLYVLDSTNQAVYRFRQSSGGFGSAPQKVLSAEELRSARRLSIDEDILTGSEGGTYHRFSGQLSLVLGQGGIDKRLTGPANLFALESGGDLAVADPANDRIVVLRRDGTFDRQYRHADFEALSAIAVRGQAVYVFSGGQVRRVVP